MSARRKTAAPLTSASSPPATDLLLSPRSSGTCSLSSRPPLLTAASSYRQGARIDRHQARLFRFTLQAPASFLRGQELSVRLRIREPSAQNQSYKALLLRFSTCSHRVVCQMTIFTMLLRATRSLLPKSSRNNNLSLSSNSSSEPHLHLSHRHRKHKRNSNASRLFRLALPLWRPKTP